MRRFGPSQSERFGPRGGGDRDMPMRPEEEGRRGGVWGRGMGMEREREVDAWRRGTRIEEEGPPGGDGMEEGTEGEKEVGMCGEKRGGMGGEKGAGKGEEAKAWEQKAVAKANSALEEYLSARDFKEVCLCMEELQSPQQHGAILAKWVATGLDKKEAQRKVVEDLVVRLCSEPKPALFTWAQIEQGLVRVFQDLEDWSVDAPQSPAARGPPDWPARGESCGDGGGDQSDGGGGGGGEGGEGGEGGGGDGAGGGDRGSGGVYGRAGEGEEGEGGGGQEGAGAGRCCGPARSSGGAPDGGLAKGEPAEAVLKWLQANTPPDAVSSPAFPRLLMRSLLQHAIGSSTADFKKLLEGPVKKYAKVFQQYASGKQKANQIQYLFGAQEFAESRRHPQGLLAAVFRALYDLDVVDEPMFFKWQDDNKDPTPGKQKAYLDVRNFLNWLSTAPEEGMEENGASGEEDS
ncbi:hypothetical protein CLOM_g15504 [Closterium sp. NIES-68]|nr:hypothetical protein CLOM_g15504 [Closterium sp. NIES-68]